MNVSGQIDPPTPSWIALTRSAGWKRSKIRTCLNEGKEERVNGYRIGQKTQAPAYFGERGDAYVLIYEYAIN